MKGNEENYLRACIISLVTSKQMAGGHKTNSLPIYTLNLTKVLPQSCKLLFHSKYF